MIPLGKSVLWKGLDGGLDLIVSGVVGHDDGRDLFIIHGSEHLPDGGMGVSHFTGSIDEARERFDVADADVDYLRSLLPKRG